MRRVIALALALLLGASVAWAQPQAARQEETVYVLSAAQLMEIADEAATTGIALSDEGLIGDGTGAGDYVSLPVEMNEFTKLSLDWAWTAEDEALMPRVSVSVYRQDEATWSEWIALPSGEAAKREHDAKQKRVCIRYRIELPCDDAGRTAAVSSLMVTGGDHLFTQSNLIMLFIMLSAFVMYIWRKKQARRAQAQ